MFNTCGVGSEKVILKKCLDANAWVVEKKDGFCACSLTMRYDAGITHNFTNFISVLLSSTNPLSCGYTIKSGFLTFEMKCESESTFRAELGRLKSNLQIVAAMMKSTDEQQVAFKDGQADIQSMRVPGHDYF